MQSTIFLQPLCIPVQEIEHDPLDGLFSDHDSDCASDCSDGNWEEDDILNVYSGEEGEDEVVEEDEGKDTDEESGVNNDVTDDENCRENGNLEREGDQEDPCEREDVQESCVLVDSAREGIEEQLSSHAEQQPDDFGFTLTMDNIDLNVRRSFQRCDRSTLSYHFTHVFAAQNRVSSSGKQDGFPSGVLSPEDILPSKADWEKLVDDFEVLVSR